MLPTRAHSVGPGTGSSMSGAGGCAGGVGGSPSPRKIRTSCGVHVTQARRLQRRGRPGWPRTLILSLAGPRHLQIPLFFQECPRPPFRHRDTPLDNRPGRSARPLRRPPDLQIRTVCWFLQVSAGLRRAASARHRGRHVRRGTFVASTGPATGGIAAAAGAERRDVKSDRPRRDVPTVKTTTINYYICQPSCAGPSMGSETRRRFERPPPERDLRLAAGCHVAIETGFRLPATAAELAWLDSFARMAAAGRVGMCSARPAHRCRSAASCHMGQLRDTTTR
jgi:hypothetical protein